MVFCAYCGKSFTRKEHLERHIPSHTNVKPHRCSSCQLSFARRDLLQRHHSTYHEARDPMEPLPGGVPTVAGRTPIACQNCANAKTGCDKRVPCTRCAEKNLPCAARFARRSSKAAVRAAQANVAFQQQMMPVATQPQTTSIMPFMDVDPTLSKQDNSPIQILTGSPLDIIDPSMTENHLPTTSSAHSHPCSGDFSSSPDGVEGFDEIMQLDGTDFLVPASQYHDMMGWPEYSMGLDLYSNQIPFDPDLSASGFADLSDVASVSEPITSASSRASTSHTRSTSIASAGDYEVNVKPPDPGNVNPGDDTSMPEFKAVVEAEKYWNFARCNSNSGTCPRTAIVHLECLERKSREEGAWSSLEKYIDTVDWDVSETAAVCPMTTRARDRMLAITQSFLLKALDIHRGGLNGCSQASHSGRHDFCFIVLPSLKILEYLLRSHVRNLSDYYPSVVFGRIDPDEMLRNSKASTLLILLMIAQGASALPVAEARYLSAGLIETCRISLFDMIEKDIELSADPVMLHCALLFTNLGAWSGDKALMDIAMGQRGMYLSMLKHAGMLEPQPSMIPASSGNSSSNELQWREWRHRELQNRLVANFVICDQELSLFYDSPPMLSIAELLCPIPSPEALWQSESASECYERVRETYSCAGGLHANAPLFQTSSLTPSLHDLFQDFLHDNLSRHRPNLSPQQLRLLLHPLQSLLCHLSQMLSCFSDVLSVRRPSTQEITRASTQLRLEEAQGLLEKWYGLAASYSKAHPSCKSTICNLILYHLISLNAVTNFPGIERLARRDDFDGSTWELSLRHKRCVRNREEVLFRCGQVARLMRSLPPSRRPAWWSAAVYRATLIIWVDSVARQDPSFQVAQNRERQQQQQQHPPVSSAPSSPSTPQGPQRASVPVTISNAPTQQQQLRDFERGMVALDQVTPEDPTLISFLWSGGDGPIPVLTRRDGSCTGLDKPNDVLEYGIALLEEGTRCRVSDGIKRKLVALGKIWGVVPGTA